MRVLTYSEIPAERTLVDLAGYRVIRIGLVENGHASGPFLLLADYADGSTTPLSGPMREMSGAQTLFQALVRAEIAEEKFIDLNQELLTFPGSEKFSP